VSTDVGDGSDSAVRFGRVARQLHPNEPTFKALMRPSESGAIGDIRLLFEATKSV
jgi:hypothetical protein